MRNLLAVPLAAVLLACGCTRNPDAGASADTATRSGVDSVNVASVNRDTVHAGVRALLDGYPDCIKGYDHGALIMADGSTLVYDDGKEKDFVTMLDNSDPEDMFSMTYRVQNPPEYLADAGRSRCEVLFKKMYGSSAAEVQRRLVDVAWFGQTVKFTSVNGGADSLRAVAAELASYPDLRPYLKSSGTFYWRTVRGARRQSAHSYGIAFDIGVDHSDYWLWKNAGASETDRVQYANRIPLRIVEIFQRHGFIWGGAWYHFDTMHFEYRPEILRFAGLLK